MRTGQLGPCRGQSCLTAAPDKGCWLLSLPHGPIASGGPGAVLGWAARSGWSSTGTLICWSGPEPHVAGGSQDCSADLSFGSPRVRSWRGRAEHSPKGRRLPGSWGASAYQPCSTVITTISLHSSRGTVTGWGEVACPAPPSRRDWCAASAVCAGAGLEQAHALWPARTKRTQPQVRPKPYPDQRVGVPPGSGVFSVGGDRSGLPRKGGSSRGRQRSKDSVEAAVLMSKPDAEKARPGKRPHTPPQLASCASTPPCHGGCSVTRVAASRPGRCSLELGTICDSSEGPVSLLIPLPRDLPLLTPSAALSSHCSPWPHGHPGWFSSGHYPGGSRLARPPPRSHPRGSFAEGDGLRANGPCREGCFPSSETVDPHPGGWKGSPGLGVQLV